MESNKTKIIKNICYTDLVYGRINKKLQTESTNSQIETFLLKVLEDTSETNYVKIGKNFYVSNSDNNIRITVNSYTFRVITVDRLH